MRYRVIAKANCRGCKHAWMIDTDLRDPGFIDAKTEAEAAEKFKLIHSLCPTCLASGTPVAVEFEGYVHVDTLPRFGSK